MMLLDGTPIYRTSYSPSRRQIMVTRTIQSSHTKKTGQHSKISLKDFLCGWILPHQPVVEMRACCTCEHKGLIGFPPSVCYFRSWLHSKLCLYTVSICQRTWTEKSTELPGSLSLNFWSLHCYAKFYKVNMYFQLVTHIFSMLPAFCFSHAGQEPWDEWGAVACFHSMLPSCGLRAKSLPAGLFVTVQYE